MRITVWCIVALCLLGNCNLALGVTVLNGDFEEHSYSGSYREFLVAGSAGLAHWSIDAGDVDLYYDASLGTPPTPPLNGSKSWLDMNGDHPGTISQSFSTMSGVEYLVTFDLGGNPDKFYNPAVKTLRVSAAGQFADFTCDTKHLDWNWAAQSWTFMATDAVTTLSFASLSGSGFNRAGPALDNVAVQALQPAIPEPLSLAAVLCGIGGLGVYVRKRWR